MQNKNDTDYAGMQSFVGGESQDNKYGGKYQYYTGRHIDVRKQPSGFSVLPGTSKTSAGDVTDLVQDMTQVTNGTRYALGDAGNVYRITTAGVWSKIGNIGEAGGAGIVYRSDVDAVYITGQTKVARIKNANTAPVLDVNWFQYGVSAASSCYKTGGTNTYTVPNTIQETTVNRRPFVTDIEPIVRNGVKCVAKGTGDWTLTVHDDANNVLGTATITNANMVAGQVNYFVFSPGLRAIVSTNNFTSTSSGGRTYHYHVTATGTGATLQTTTADSLVDCDMELWASALVPTVNGLHPIYNFAQLTLFANEKYVAAYEPLQDLPTTSDFQRHRLQLPSGFETNGIAQLELYAAFTAEKRSTSAAQDFQESKLLLWDGRQTTYNRFFDIPEGSAESLTSHKNVLYMIAGGKLYLSSGGQPVDKWAFRGTDSEYSNIADSTHVNPHMMTVRRGVLLMGYPSITTVTSLEHRVYGYGRKNDNYPVSLTTNYSLSTGTSLNDGSNNLRIGMVKNYGDTLYISWREGTTYGVDIVNNSSTPASSFEVSLRYFDNEKPYKEKLAKRGLAVFDDLPAGVSLRMWYKLNGESTKHYSTDDGTAYVTSGNVVQVSIPRQFIGVEVGLEGTISGTTSPFCRFVGVAFDPQPDRSEISQSG